MSGPAERYVALGSSFGAGPGLRPRAGGSPRRAGRSRINAAHLLADRSGLPLVDATFSGATVAQLRAGGPGRAVAQIGAVDSRTALVTVTAGGNDVGYLPALTFASVPRPLGTLFRATRRVAAITDPIETDRRFERLASDFRTLLRDVSARAPEARIVVVGYLTILPPAGTDAPPLPEGVASWGRAAARRLAETQAAAAAETGAMFVDVASASIAHHAWSSDPWTRGFHYGLRGGAPYHPNAAGMQAVARLIQDRLGGRE